MRTSAWLVGLLVIGLVPSVGLAQERPSALSIDALVDIKHPSGAKWSPDGSQVAYLWDRGGVQNVWLVAIAGGAPRPLTSYPSDLIESLDWSADGGSLLFVRQGRLWRGARGGGEPQAVWPASVRVGALALSPDRARAVFVRDQDLYLRPVGTGAELRLTHGLGAVSGPAWSPDGTRILFSFGPVKRVEESASYAGSKVVFTRSDHETGRVGVVPIAGGPVVTLAKSPGGEEAPRWLDRRHVVLQRVSDDLKSREVVVSDVRTGAGTVVHRDVDPKFWSLTYLGAEPVPSPDGKWIAFVSDRDGWDHLYVVAATGGEAVQVTRGRFEVTRFSWSPDSKRIAFDRNEEERPGVRQLVIATLDGGPATAKLETVTSGRGTNTNARWSPDGRRLLFEHTDPKNSADFYVTDAAAGATAHRLTESMPPTVDRGALVEPQFVRYAGPDGGQVPAYLFVPPGLDRSRKHPAIVWVHGDGINQNYDGWHIHRDYGVYYSIQQYFLQQGYVVLSVDYRGSIGYGRDWRQGHYRDLGGKDYGDIAAGAAYLKTLGYVDPDRLGIWGLSYGGFMALQALTVTPELFRCAIDVAGVVDWTDWYRDPGGPWIRGRMGRPEDDPDLYRRLSPIYHLDKVVRPLLVLHGTSDENVPFLESVRLMDELIKTGKNAEFVMYPGEFHYFQRAHVLGHAWRTAARFFDRHLKGN